MKKIKLIALIFLIIFILSAFFLVRPYYLFLTKTLKISPFKTLTNSSELKTINNTVNILILGIPGGNHDGPNLSDSINVVHYDMKTNKITVIGIPRDIWSDTLQDKINSAYSYGEEKQKGGGLKLAKAEVAGIIGQPIPYGIVISFDKFRQLIDYLGGIDVTVERAFTDHDFPVTGKEDDTCGGDPDYRCRYETVSFQKGLQHMDGTTALKFVRSRHAEGIEGSDFARNHRQQLVMSAVKNKIIAEIKSLNINRISKLYTETNSLVERDISNQEVSILAKNGVLNKKIEQQNVPLALDMFEVPNADGYYGKYVLIPPNDSFESIHSYIACVFDTGNEKKCNAQYFKSEEE
jgi:LCP family protein required for cell wall assembly